MFHSLAPLVLASASPRRRRFLQQLGLDFRVEAADVDERVLPGETPESFVLRLAVDKARAVAAQRPDQMVIAADTAVVLGEEILGKPDNPAAAVEMLLRLAGRSHAVWTGYAVIRQDDGIEVARAVRTDVRMVDFNRNTAAAYVATGEPLDKAGSYGIQGRGGCLVERIDGSYSNVVGLPVAELVADLERLGVIAPAGPLP